MFNSRESECGSLAAVCSLLKAISFTTMHAKISLIPRPRPASIAFSMELETMESWAGPGHKVT